MHAEVAVVSNQRSRQREPPCSDRLGLNRILMCTGSRESGGGGGDRRDIVMKGEEREEEETSVRRKTQGGACEKKSLKADRTTMGFLKRGRGGVRHES